MILLLLTTAALGLGSWLLCGIDNCAFHLFLFFLLQHLLLHFLLGLDGLVFLDRLLPAGSSVVLHVFDQDLNAGRSFVFWGAVWDFDQLSETLVNSPNLFLECLKPLGFCFCEFLDSAVNCQSVTVDQPDCCFNRVVVYVLIVTDTGTEETLEHGDEDCLSNDLELEEFAHEFDVAEQLVFRAQFSLLSVLLALILSAFVILLVLQKLLKVLSAVVEKLAPESAIFGIYGCWL